MSLYPDWLDEDITIIEPEEEQTQEGYSYVYNYDNNEVVITTSGKTNKSTYHNSYLFWVYKNLVTERFERSAYSDDFGTEIEAIISSDYSRPVAESEISRSIKEALLVDDRTIDVFDFEFDWDGDMLHIYFKLESIYNTDVIDVRRGI